MSINLLVQDGIVKSPALRYDSNSKPEFRFTLNQQDGDFHLWLPCCASGSAAERLASEIEEGQHLIITSGRLCYRKRQTQKSGEVSRLEILVWQVDRLDAGTPDTHEPSPEYDVKGEVPTFNAGHSGEPETQQTREPAPKARRMRYPRYTGAQTAMREP